MKTITPFIIYAANNRLHEVGELCEEAGLKFKPDSISSRVCKADKAVVYREDINDGQVFYYDDSTYNETGDAKLHYPFDLQAIKKHLGLKTTVDFTPLPEITGFGIKGSKSLLKAFAEEAIKSGWVDKRNASCPDLVFNISEKNVVLKPKAFWDSNVGDPENNYIILNLPSQWDEAIECLKLINQPQILEVTLKQVADKFGVKVENIRIKE